MAYSATQENQLNAQTGAFLASKNASLVNTANISAIQAHTGLQHKRQISQFTLLGYAKNILTKHNVLAPRSGKSHRTRHCHSYKQAGTTNVSVSLNNNPNDSRASITDVQTCGCIWSCPVCYERQALERGLLIQKAIAYAKSENLVPLLMTLTTAHDNSMSLADVEVPFKKAWRKFSSDRRWQDFKKDFGLQHYISNVDTTYSDKNGWHYHNHILMFLDLSEISVETVQEDVKSELVSYWKHCLGSQDLSGSSQHALHVSSPEASANEYIAKINLTTNDDGKLHYEMTSQTTKDGGRTIWDILMLANIGSIKNELLYIEYVNHMTGNNWIKFSHGLKALAEDFVIEEDQGEEDVENKMTKWLIMSDYWWDIVKWSYGYADLINVSARTRDISEVRELLYSMRANLIDENRLSDYYRNYVPIENSIADVRMHEDWTNDTRREI